MGPRYDYTAMIVGEEKMSDHASKKKMQLKDRPLKKVPFSIKSSIQRVKQGYSDVEIDRLDESLVRWIIPRLKAFKSRTNGHYPANLRDEDEWHEKLDEMIFGLEFLLNSDKYWWDLVADKDKEDLTEGRIKFRGLVERAQAGRMLFGEYISCLWR